MHHGPICAEEAEARQLDVVPTCAIPDAGCVAEEHVWPEKAQGSEVTAFGQDGSVLDESVRVAVNVRSKVAPEVLFGLTEAAGRPEPVEVAQTLVHVLANLKLELQASVDASVNDVVVRNVDTPRRGLRHGAVLLKLLPVALLLLLQPPPVCLVLCPRLQLGFWPVVQVRRVVDRDGPDGPDGPDQLALAARVAASRDAVGWPVSVLTAPVTASFVAPFLANDISLVATAV